jgi:CBS-domain-containing membrane protein
MPLPSHRAAKSAVIGGVLIGLMILCTSVLGTGLILTSWVSSMALLLSAPMTQATRPRVIVGCHMMTAVVGVMGVWVTAGASWGIGATVAVALLIAFWAEIMHPPAIANAAIAFVYPTSKVLFLASALCGAVALAAATHAIIFALKERPAAKQKES